MQMYDAGAMKLPTNFMPEHPFDAGVHAIRDEKLMKSPRTGEGIRKRLAEYYAVITHTDAQIGRILDALDKSGKADNTIIVFASDNGLALGSHGLLGKQNIYEHSVKVPFMISGPGIPAGEKRDQLCYIYDIYPTLCELAGLTIPGTVQFQSFKPVLADAQSTHRKNLYFSFMGVHRGVRDERYKLIEYCVDGDRHTQLFDLQQDPEETNNLAEAEANALVLERMRALLESERKRLNDGGPDNPEHILKMSKAFWSTYEAGE